MGHKRAWLSPAEKKQLRENSRETIRTKRTRALPKRTKPLTRTHKEPKA